MSIRYLGNLLLALAGGFLVVVTMAFSPPVAAGLVFAVSIGITLVGLGMAAGLRDLVQRTIGGLIAAIGVWTVIASLVFLPTTVVWLGFASALAFVALAIAGLTAHELTTERVVHSLEVSSRRERAPRERVAA